MTTWLITRVWRSLPRWRRVSPAGARTAAGACLLLTVFGWWRSCALGLHVPATGHSAAFNLSHQTALVLLTLAVVVNAGLLLPMRRKRMSAAW